MDKNDDHGQSLSAILGDAARLAALKATGLPDSGAEPSFDRLSRLAAKLLGTPVALVSLVDAERQFFKCCVGLPEPWSSRRETPLSHSFCQHVVVSGKPLVIEDARTDPRVKDNLAIRDLGVVAYLGIPITVYDQVIGSFCAIDGKPKAWTQDEIATMNDLAQSVISEILLRTEYRDAVSTKARIETTLASIGEGVITTDVKGTITGWNAGAETIFGYAQAEAIGKPIAMIFTPEDQAAGVPQYEIDKAADSGEAQDKRWHRKKDNSLFFADGRVRPIKGEAGKVIGFTKVLRDATVERRSEAEREQLVEQLSDARIRLDAALQAGAISTWTWDVPNHSIVADANLARLFSVSPEEANGGGPEAYLRSVHDDDRGPLTARLEEIALHGGVYDEVYRVVQPDDSVRWLHAKGKSVADETGRIVALPGIVLDITESRNQQTAIQESERRYRTLFEAMNEGFCILQLKYDDRGTAVDYRFLEVNPAFQRLTGASYPTGKWVSELLPNVTREWHERYGRIARTGIDERFEMEEPSMDGRSFAVYAFRTGEPDEHKVAVLFNEITHRRQAEAEREQLVHRLTDADRRKDEFLAMLAHELRNPLGVISNGVQLVQTVQKPELLTQIREIIQHQVVHLTHLIDDLLDVSRITQGKIELRKKTVELSGIVGRAVEMVKTIIAEKHHALTVSLPDYPVHFVADQTRTEQILGNLLTNAAKYSPPDGSIHLSADVEGDQIIFRVRDRGEGISAEMLPKIFGLFTQIDATIHRSQGGLGIGLTLVKSLAEMHGGSVSAASEGKGKGSEFIVRLPIGHPTVEEIRPAPGVQNPPEADGRILVVDDNVETVNLTARMLKHRGYEVKTANDGNEAVEIARAFQPKFILLDIGLPGLDGYQVAARLRHDDCCKKARIIAISGYGEQQSRERSRRAGIDYHLTKPVDFDQLNQLLVQPLPADA